MLYFGFFYVILVMAFLRGLEKAPTFLVPIINPPFADNSPHLSCGLGALASKPRDMRSAVWI